MALTLALACLLVVGALGFTLYTASEDMEDSLVEQLVFEEMDYLVRRHQNDPAFQPRQGSSIQSYIIRDASAHGQVPEHLLGLTQGQHDFFVNRKEYHALVREMGGTRYIVAYEVGLHEQREQDFRFFVLLSVLTAALVSLLLGYWLSGILVSQVTELARTVSDLRPGGPKGSLVRADQDAEVALLARAFDDYQARIEHMIRREQEFTANASHELRTPLTAIKTSCELLLAETLLGEKSRARVEWINAAAGRMAEQVQALLFLARGEALGSIEPVALADCLAEALEPYRGEIAHKGLVLELDVPGEAVLALNYQALRIVLSNLIRNAVHYTERGFIRIRYAAKRLSVADSGRGINPEHLPHVLERFFRAEDAVNGMGLGLSIVKRICDHCGWEISVESVPMKGSVFSIQFP